MPNFRELYAGKFLRAEDVKDKPFKGIIERVESEKMNDGKEKVVVYFENRKRGLVLNCSRYEQIVALAKSHETDNWQGLSLLVHTGKTKNPQGKTVDCLVVGNGKEKSAAQKRREVKASLGDDGIPAEGDALLPFMQPDADDDDM
jgi:hypothetical protein